MATRPYTLYGLGHTTSPLFTKLPLEIRRMVYDEVFNGSKRQIQRKRIRRDPNARYAEDNQIMVPTNDRFQLLLTCQEVYIEARHLYWGKTAITCGFFQMRTLLGAIPTFAREDIEVLKDVPPRDELASTYPMQLDQFLDYFPRLQYCQLRRHTLHMWCHRDEIPPQGLLKMSGSEAFQELALSLNAAKPPVFVQRIYVWPKMDSDTVVWAYVNHTHGRIHVAAKGSISDEEGFKKVTGPVEKAQDTEETQKIQDTQETDKSNVEQDLINFHKAIHGDKGLEADEKNDVQETSLTDDTTEVNDMEVYEDKLEGLDDMGEDDKEVTQVEE